MVEVHSHIYFITPPPPFSGCLTCMYGRLEIITVPCIMAVNGCIFGHMLPLRTSLHEWSLLNMLKRPTYQVMVQFTVIYLQKVNSFLQLSFFLKFSQFTALVLKIFILWIKVISQFRVRGHFTGDGINWGFLSKFKNIDVIFLHFII